MRVFIAFAAPDRAHLQRLKTALAAVCGSSTARGCYERDIAADSSPESPAALASSDLLLALMSPDFLASDYCASQELATAIMLHEAGCLRIVPVLLERCEWKDSRLGRLKPLPQLGAPVSEWHDPEDAYREIIAGLRALVQHELAIDLPGGAGALS